MLWSEQRALVEECGARFVGARQRSALRGTLSKTSHPVPLPLGVPVLVEVVEDVAHGAGTAKR